MEPGVDKVYQNVPLSDALSEAPLGIGGGDAPSSPSDGARRLRRTVASGSSVNPAESERCEKLRAIDGARMVLALGALAAWNSKDCAPLERRLEGIACGRANAVTSPSGA